MGNVGLSGYFTVMLRWRSGGGMVAVRPWPSGGAGCMATLLAHTAHRWADVRDSKASLWRVASGNLTKEALYNRSQEE